MNEIQVDELIIQDQSSISQLENPKELTPEEAILKVGGNGPFQWKILSIIGLSNCLPLMVVFGLSYLQKEPQYYCPSQNGSFVDCNKEQACSQYPAQFHYHYDIYNWNRALGLQCESKSRLGLIGSIFFFGWMVGALIFPRMADLCGRKPLVLGSYVVQVIVMIMMLLAPNLETIYGALFLLGLKVPPGNQVSYVMMLEFTNANKRNFYGTFILGMIGFQSVLLSGYYALFRDYRGLFVFNIALTLLLLVVFWLFVPESPRYYISRGKFKQARRMFQKIATTNKKPMFQELLEGQSPNFEEPESSGKLKNGMCDLIKAGFYILLPLIIMSLNWFIVTLVFYGFAIGLKYIEANLFLIGFVSAISEFIGTSLSYFCASKLGRKRGLILTQFIAGVACFAYKIVIATESQDWKIALCLLFGVFGNAAAFNIIYLYTSELFPTSFRATVFGITNFVARLGGVVAPLLNQFMRSSYMIVFGIVSLISCVITLLLRETKGTELLDTLDTDNDNAVKSSETEN